MSKYGTVLIADDNTSILTAMRYLLDGTFERILTLTQPDDILKTMAQEEIDLVLLDMNFSLGVNSGQEGLFWLRAIRKQHPQTPVVERTEKRCCRLHHQTLGQRRAHPQTERRARHAAGDCQSR